MPRFLGPMPNTWLRSLISNSFVRPRVVLICLLNSTLLGIDFPYEARVTKLEDLNHNVKRVRMRLVNPEGFGFKPGQFVFLKIPDNHVREWNQKYQTSHENISRPYSFASSPRRLPLFDFIIKLAAAPRGKDVPPGLASTYVHTRLGVGDLVRISPPQGSLYLGIDKGRPIVVIAGGSGAAPFVGLLEYWIENGVRPDQHDFVLLRSPQQEGPVSPQSIYALGIGAQEYFLLPRPVSPSASGRMEGRDRIRSDRPR